MSPRRLLSLLSTAITVALPLGGGHAPAAAPAASGPAPGTPEYVARDTRNIADAYGRQTGQQASPQFALATQAETTDVGLAQLAQQMAAPSHPAITPGNVFPGWNMGNPYRRGWDGRRGQLTAVAFTNRYGALLRGHVFAPLPGARDPYTGAALKPPYPGVVITTGSVQGSERMYWWLAQDLAERGYVVVTYDVQGQGTSETFPHENDQVNALPFCNPFATPRDGEMLGCPGVPFQQESNFVFGTQDALDFFMATPSRPYKNPHADDTAQVNAYNPYWKLIDRRPDARTVTPGRTTKVAIIGHSLGAAAVSYVQGVDRRVEAVVALDKLMAEPSSIQTFGPVKPVVPALAVQSEYGFTVSPYWMSGGSSLTPQPASPAQRPDPRREEKTGFDAWRKAGVDTMLVVPRASTHLEYTDIAYALPASRYGQDVASVYVQAWLDRYLKHRPAAPLLATRFKYLEPVAVGHWAPVALDRGKQLSFYYCSGYALRGVGADADIGGVGGC